MTVRAHTVAFVGVEARLVEVQCSLTPGLPAFNIVGLADKAVSESKERVRAALNVAALAMPPSRITINLSPSDLPKTGSHYDVPIALALMAAIGAIRAEDVEGYLALGELSLDGVLTPVTGVLPAAVAAAAADKGLICPAGCGAEAAWVGAADVLAPRTLVEVINHFAGRAPLHPPVPGDVLTRRSMADLADVKGQESARRALEVAAAGNHHLLMAGEPGSGKSMLAARLTGIMPRLTAQEALDVSMIHSLADQPGTGAICRERPYRDPHHSASMAAMIGGGRQARPGEISLAHHGVLFLDELPEFARSVLDALRQPIETGEAIVARANAHVTYPANFLLVAAMNPCRCGYLTDPARACSRAPKCGADYRARLSGPLLDRFDIRIEVPPVSASVLGQPGHGETSERVASRVEQARGMQRERTDKPNSELEGEVLDRVAQPDSPGLAMLQEATEKFRYSARGYHRVLRLARTLADLDASDAVRKVHIAEAVSYRRFMS